MKYRVLAPCAFISKGKAVHQMKVGVTVDVDESEGSSLAAAGKLEPVETKPPLKTVKAES